MEKLELFAASPVDDGVPIVTELKVPRSLSHGLKAFKPVRRASLSPQLDESPKTIVELPAFKLATYNPTAKTKYLTQQFELHEILGRGSFGQVYGAKCKRTGNFFAVKKALHQCSRTLPEHDILYQLCHSKIIKIFGAWREAEHVFTILELCSYPLSYVMKVQSGSAISTAAWNVLADISEALAHLHLNKVIHNDVKPDNILVTSNGIYKLADFNVSVEWKRYGKVEAEALPRGDDRYSAPECIAKHVYNDRIDIYAFGATLLNFLIGRPAEANELEMTNLDGFLNANVGWSLRQVLRKMLDHEPAVRPSARTLLYHEIVTIHKTDSNGRGPVLSEEQIEEYENGLFRKSGNEDGENISEDLELRRWILEDEYIIKPDTLPRRVSLRNLDESLRLNCSDPQISSDLLTSPVLKPKRLSLRNTSERISTSSDDSDLTSPITKRNRPSISFRRRLFED
ncbi:unnamed protein product [Bursaphelenchus xylophilus]|uniref:(pine wood nematode) hypothetical protein n=1 Tax=Bursaphelenchus xylophilus TaxID=6326 RepID=A0A1I7RJX7_BURXY|nr:unnamed protein product [Bursaphelenchus xylophilus]CAG9129146.1 unnamed protein product [Bursaphelenchus xylophilus]